MSEAVALCASGVARTGARLMKRRFSAECGRCPVFAPHPAGRKYDGIALLATMGRLLAISALQGGRKNGRIGGRGFKDNLSRPGQNFS